MSDLLIVIGFFLILLSPCVLALEVMRREDGRAFALRPDRVRAFLRRHFGLRSTAHATFSIAAREQSRRVPSLRS